MTVKTPLDPRTKLVIVLSLSTAGVLIRSIGLLTGVLAISIIVALLFKSPFFSILQKLKRILWVIFFLILIQSIFTVNGRSVLSIGSFTIVTVEGIMLALQLVMRMMIVITSAAIMTTNSSREIIQGLVQWKVPYEVAFMVSIAIRFLPMLSEEIKDVVTAIQLRGIELEKIPIKKRIKVYSYVLMPIVASTLTKARKLSTAMETRAFGVYEDRTSYHILKMQGVDYVFIAISILGLFAIMSYYYIGGLHWMLK